MLRKTIDFHPFELVEYFRSGLLEQVYSGFIVKLDFNGKIKKLGNDNDYPFFMRSCAKPLQTTALIDLGCDEKLSLKEIALCTSSHSGDEKHIKIVNDILKKANLDETYLHCGIDKPLSADAQEKLIIDGKKEAQIHNNCSGKHAMMLTISKKMGWSLNDYYENSHPLQKYIQKKIYELCELKEDYPVTKDGCGVPICSMPLKNMVKGYMNVFFDKKYSKIKDAFLTYPELISGDERLDCAIMCANKDLIMKGGAGGVCVILNLKTKEGLAIKMVNLEKYSRELVIIEALRQLGWLNNQVQSEKIKKHNCKDVFTLLGEKVGGVNFLFDFSASALNDTM